MNLLKNKHFSIFAAASALAVASFNLPTAFASSAKEEEKEINPVIVENAIKPTLMSQNFEAKKVAEARATKLAEVKAEQQRIEEEERARAEAERQAAEEEAQRQAQEEADRQAAQQQVVSQAPSQQESGVNQGQFTLSFYDPAVLGSDLGYDGVAANLSVFPKGTTLKITLSDGTVWYRVVNDTGAFAYSNPRQLDVAMPNDMIPSAGILYATVEVL